MKNTKQYLNQYGYSDVAPYEIIKFSPSGKTAYIRAMLAEKDKSWKPNFIPGGFAGHCTNQDKQEWIITSDSKQPIIKARLHKNGTWHSSNGHHGMPSSKPVRFYDYNF